MKKVVKWGIIGLGNVAYEFANAFNFSQNAKLIALSSKSEKKLEEFGKHFGINKNNLFNSYNQIIENNDIDIFYIALTNNLHFDLIEKLVEKKKNILVEKPAFLSVKEAEIIFNKKNFDNIFFSEGYMYRYHPQIGEIIKIIKAGKIGKLIKMETNFGTNLIYKKNLLGFKKLKFDNSKRIFNKYLGGGVIFDLGCYTTSMSLLIASLKKKIKINNYKFRNIKTEYLNSNIDVHSSAEINFDDVFSSKLTISFAKEVGKKTKIQGDQGQIILENNWDSEITQLSILGKANKVKNFRNTKNLYSLEIEKISKDIIENKVEATFPGIDKKNIFLNTKIINDWLNG